MGYSYEEMIEWYEAQKTNAEENPEDKTDKRQPLSDEQVTGKVKYVRKDYGIITPNIAISHHIASRSDGDVWFDFKDVVGCDDGKAPAWLIPGSDVSFHVYADSQSLGAEEVMAA